MGDIVIGAVLGIILGLGSHQLAVMQIRTRVSDMVTVKKLNRVSVIIAWCVILATISAFVFWQKADWITRIESLIIVSVASSIATVDFSIKRIPNESLLILLAAKIISIISIMFMGGTFMNTIFPPIIGFVIGSLLYLIPSMLHIPIGAGDIKYCAVIGFCLGIYGFLQTSIIMAIALAIYLAYLMISKKGSIRTAAAMGPFLTLGVVITVMAPIAALFN